MEALPHVDLLVGNHTEADAFAMAAGWPGAVGDYGTIATRIAR